MTAYQHIRSNKRRSVLLIIGFMIIILFIGAAFAYLSDAGPGALVLAVGIATGMSLFSYYGGDKVALLTSGARGPIAKEDNPQLYRIIENLTITAGMPMPKVYIIEDSVPNAFATGRDPEHASVAFTTGLLQVLENEELEGVAAHELSHIQNYDIRVMTIVIICVGIVSLLANWFLRFSFFGNNNRSSRAGNVGLILAIIGIVLIIFSPIISKLIQFAVSRKREYLADASGVLLTRYPEGLARALEKINMYAAPMKRANSATAHLFISNPFGKQRKWRNLFSTHPPAAERIAALRSIA